MPRRWTVAFAWIVGIALPGALAGRAVGVGLGQAAGEQAPPGWQRIKTRPGYVTPVVAGELAPRPDAWSLARFDALAAPVGSRRVELVVELSPDGELLLLLDRSGRGTGSGVALRRGGRPSGGVVVDGAAGESPLPCEGAVAAAEDEPSTLVFEVDEGGFSLVSPGGRLRCAADTRDGRPTLVAGLGRLRLTGLAVGGAPVPPPEAPIAAGALAGAVLALAWAGALRLLGLGLWGVIFSLSPLWLGMPLAGADAASVYELARLPFQRGLRLAPALVAILPSLALGLWGLGASPVPAGAHRKAGVIAGLAALLATVLVAGAPIQNGDKAPLLGLICLLVVGPGAGLAGRLLRRPDGPPVLGAVRAAALGALVGAALGAGADQGLARLYFAFAGASVGGLLWSIRHALGLRLYNVVALCLALSSLGALEVGLRWTSLGQRWDGEDLREAGSSATLSAQFQALERGPKGGDYPAAGFPVALPPRRAAQRIACLGGSSTGGAWQNKSLDEFYPALLDAALQPEVEVVNQGAGSWTSFHVRQYVENWLEAADAQVVTVYLGVNEGTLAPASYADLHARWKAGKLGAGPSVLARLRLLNGLRYLGRGLRGHGDVAVDPDEFGDNLDAIADAVTARGGRVLLVREVVYPSGEAFGAWAAEMQTAAQDRDGVAYLDPSPRLLAFGSGAFLDQNHLSPAGHAALAEALQQRLSELGWLEGAGPGPKR